MDEVHLLIMSGRDDGMPLVLHKERDGIYRDGHWKIRIGRLDENDLVLRNDTFISRHHAILHWKKKRWWIEDLKSKNGTFTENPEDIFNDKRVKSKPVPIQPGQLFRIGRTWMCIQAADKR